MLTALIVAALTSTQDIDVTGIYTITGPGLAVENGAPGYWKTGGGSVFLIQKGQDLQFAGDNKGEAAIFRGTLDAMHKFKVLSSSKAAKYWSSDTPEHEAAMNASGKREWLDGFVEKDGTVQLTYHTFAFRFKDDKLDEIIPTQYPVTLIKQFIFLDSVKWENKPTAARLKAIADESQKELDSLKALSDSTLQKEAEIERLNRSIEDDRNSMKTIEPQRVAATKKFNQQKLHKMYLETALELKRLKANSKASKSDVLTKDAELKIYEKLCKDMKCPVPLPWTVEAEIDLVRDLKKVNDSEAALRAEFRDAMDTGYKLRDRITSQKHKVEDLTFEVFDQKRDYELRKSNLAARLADVDRTIWQGQPMPKSLKIKADGKLYAQVDFANPSDLIDKLCDWISEVEKDRDELARCVYDLRKEYEAEVVTEHKAYEKIPGAQVFSLFAQAGVEVGEFVFSLYTEGSKAVVDKLKDIAKEVQVKLIEDKLYKTKPSSSREIFESMWDYEVYDHDTLKEEFDAKQSLTERVGGWGNELADEMVKQLIVDGQQYVALANRRGTKTAVWLGKRFAGQTWTKGVVKWFKEAALKRKSLSTSSSSMFKDALKDFAKGQAKKGLSYIIERPFYLAAFEAEARRIHLHQQWFDANSMLNEADLLLASFKNQLATVQRDYYNKSVLSQVLKKKDPVPAGRDYDVDVDVSGKSTAGIKLFEKEDVLKLVSTSPGQLRFLQDHFIFQTESRMLISISQP